MSPTPKPRSGDRAADDPSAGHQLEWLIADSQRIPERRFQLLALVVIQRDGIRTGRSDALAEPEPQVLEVLVRRADIGRCGGHRREANIPPQLFERLWRRVAHVPFVLLLAAGIELVSRVPERAEQGHLARVVPDGRNDRP